MGILAVDSIKSRTTGPVQISDDLNVTGVSTVGVLTATSVVVGSAVTVNADGIHAKSGIVTSLQFSGDIVGTAATFTTVSIGGTLTYEDVTNVDSTGIITARSGIKIGEPTSIGATFNAQGDLVIAGVVTAGTFSGVTTWDSYDSWLYN